MSAGDSGAACSCACAQELRNLRAEFAALALTQSLAEQRLATQEQSLARALSSLLPMVEALSAKVDKARGQATTTASVSASSSASAPATAAITTCVPTISSVPSICDPVPVTAAVTPLLAAAAGGNLEAVRGLLAHSDAFLDATLRGAQGMTALHEAAWGGHVATLDALLEAAGPGAADSRGPQLRTPLHAAAHAGHTDAACSLLEAGASVDALDARNFTPLHLAARAGHRAVAALLLEEGANGNIADKSGLTPLCSAASAGRAPLVRLLLEKGAFAHSTLNVALNRAAAGGHLETALLLVQKGANVKQSDILRLTPLHKAAEHGHVQVMQMLLEEGANVDASDESLATPLVLAALGAHADAVDLLLERGASVSVDSCLSTEWGNWSRNDIKRKAYKIPLVAAAKGGSFRVVKALAKKGAASCDTKLVLKYALMLAGSTDVVWALADVAPEDFKEVARDALLFAIQEGRVATVRSLVTSFRYVVSPNSDLLFIASGHPECVAALLKAGVSVKNDRGLIAAVKIGCMSTVSAFLEHGLTDEQKTRALEVAIEEGKFRIASLLLNAGADPLALDENHASRLSEYIAKKNLLLSEVMQQRSGR